MDIGNIQLPTPVHIEVFGPEDEDERRARDNAHRYAAALWAIKQNVRARWKYGHSFKTADEAVDAIYDMINAELEQRGLGEDF